jgi:hypothetical protein
MAAIKRRFTPGNGKFATPLIPETGPFNVFVTAGLGDWLAIDAFLAPEQRARIVRMTLATEYAEPIAALVRAGGYACEIRQHVEDWKIRGCYIGIEQYLKENPTSRLAEPDDVDLSIARVFPRCSRGEFKYAGSSLVNPLASLDEFDLPPEYAVIVPRSKNKGRKGRDFNDDDWKAAIAACEAVDLPMVCVYDGEDFSLPSSQIIDIRNRTSPWQAAEVVKRAYAYLGIDTCWAVLAAKFVHPERFYVRASFMALKVYRCVYYAPAFDDVVISATLRRALERRPLVRNP